MKKLLILIMLACIGHISFVHSTNKFRHLNDLPRSAKVKFECEELQRSIIFRSNKQKACDFLDNEANKFVVTIRDQVYVAEHKKDLIDKVATLAKLTRDVGAKLTDLDYHSQIEEAVKTIIPKASDKVVAAECAMLVELTASAVKKEFTK